MKITKRMLLGGLTRLLCLIVLIVGVSPAVRFVAANQQSTVEQRGSEQSPLVVKVESGWGLSDEIAIWAIAVAALQFLALIGTLAVMIVNGRRQLRAYVLPEQGGLFDGTTLTPPNPAKTNLPMIGMIIKNGGQTPAYKVTAWAGMRVIEMRDEHVALAVESPLQEKFSLTLASGTTFQKFVSFDRVLSPNEIADIAQGTRAIYLYGRIEYRDAFKKKRYTDFRLFYANQPYPPVVPNAALNFSERGNESS